MTTCTRHHSGTTCEGAGHVTQLRYAHPCTEALPYVDPARADECKRCHHPIADHKSFGAGSFEKSTGGLRRYLGG